MSKMTKNDLFYFFIFQKLIYFFFKFSAMLHIKQRRKLQEIQRDDLKSRLAVLCSFEERWN